MPRFGQNQTMKRETFNSEVNVERDSRIGGGFYYGTHKFDWDEEAKRLNVIAKEKGLL